MTRTRGGEDHALTPDPNDLGRVLDAFPCAEYIMTACYEDERVGVRTNWVQRCCVEPPLVSVALRRGHPIEPIIRDCRSFALCKSAPNDRLLSKQFDPDADHKGDAFDSLDVETLVTGAPCLRRAEFVLDCDMHQHFDLECEYEMYIGIVRAVRIYNNGAMRNGQ